MLDEGTLRERFPEVPWDQPVLVSPVLPSVTSERLSPTALYTRSPVDGAVSDDPIWTP